MNKLNDSNFAVGIYDKSNGVNIIATYDTYITHRPIFINYKNNIIEDGVAIIKYEYNNKSSCMLYPEFIKEDFDKVQNLMDIAKNNDIKETMCIEIGNSCINNKLMLRISDYTPILFLGDYMFEGVDEIKSFFTTSLRFISQAQNIQKMHDVVIQNTNILKELK